MNIPFSIGPGILSIIAVFIAGLIVGAIVRVISYIAAFVALAFGFAGLIIPPAIGNVVSSILRTGYTGNELFFISGLLFGISLGKN